MFKKIAILFLAAATVILTAGCQMATSTTPTTTDTTTGTTGTTSTTLFTGTITLDESALILAQNAAAQLNYTLDFTNVSGTLIVFTSSDETVATVSAEGLVTAIGPGAAEIRAAYSETVYAVCTVTVPATYVLTAPNKAIYSLGEDLSVRGGSLAVYDADGERIETIALTAAMITAFDPEAVGEQIVQFTCLGMAFGFSIYILNTKQEAVLFDDFILLSATPAAATKIEFALTKGDVDLLIDAVGSVYDYQEIQIYAYFTAPSGDVKKISAFWYQEYREAITGTVVNPRNNLEGTVTVLPNDFAIVLAYLPENDPQYRMRYETAETGDFDAEVYVTVDGAVIQTFTKEFSVAADPASDYRGYVTIDATSNRHFAFSAGGTYMPVGQNVAWYTSKDRKYYDYKAWFGEMGAVGMNYARVWMAAWGFSIFWDDVYDYDTRQGNMNSLDETLELAEENGIYVQLCLLHHGMFSAEVNPMWPNPSNTWYTDKYGANPYAELLASPGLFFTSDLGKMTFKNQLDYIVARWGYSDHILAWELFNEVDWIEEYTATAGTAWHREMAEYLDVIDPYDHLVTTSVKGDSFLSGVYNVFQLDAIDFVNVHNYGIYNHVATLPVRQKNGFNIFAKPILYAEVGYSGSGGQAQIAVDPTNITLHQELWGGMMGGGAGTGMNWWWESWIHPENAYGAFQGAATYAATMDLSGSAYALLSDVSGTALSNIACAVIGYRVDDRVYAYLYDSSYALNNPTVGTKHGVTLSVPGLATGTYAIVYRNTFDGTILAQTSVTVDASGLLVMTLPDFTTDIAIAATRIGG